LLSKYGKFLNCDGFIVDCARISPKNLSPLGAGCQGLLTISSRLKKMNRPEYKIQRLGTYKGNHSTQPHNEAKGTTSFCKKMGGLTAVFIFIAFIREYFFRAVISRG